MKKSIVIYMHILFWIAILGSRFISPIITRYLSLLEYAQLKVILTFFPPLFFYVGYIAIMRIKWRKNTLFLAILSVFSSYMILFLLSGRIFAYALAPLSSILWWTTLGCLFRFFIDWFKKKSELLILEKENLSSSIALLGSQINPHFLFNTLHNIDTQIFDNQEKASKSLIKLSDIMRYMLHDARADMVELRKEIEHLESYLSLEELRLKNKNFLNYSVCGEYNGFKIAPMIMIPFVENAFKHGIDSSIDNVIRIANKTLNFICENQFDKTEIGKDKGHGIGLETVKKRLNLIYMNRHTLSIYSENSVFKVNLEIVLDEN